MCIMHKFLLGIMRALILLISLFLLYLILSALSWKIYILIYTDYTWGLFFPHAQYRSIFFFLSIAFLLLAFAIVRLIAILRKGR